MVQNTETKEREKKERGKKGKEERGKGVIERCCMEQGAERKILHVLHIDLKLGLLFLLPPFLSVSPPTPSSSSPSSTPQT